jgi:hypothetical protein
MVFVFSLFPETFFIRIRSINLSRREMGCGCSSATAVSPKSNLDKTTSIVPTSPQSQESKAKQRQRQSSRSRSVMVHEQLLANIVSEKKSINVVFLGAAEAGKSTMMKQLKIAYQDGFVTLLYDSVSSSSSFFSSFTTEEQRRYRVLILRNTVESIQALIRVPPLFPLSCSSFVSCSYPSSLFPLRFSVVLFLSFLSFLFFRQHKSFLSHTTRSSRFLSIFPFFLQGYAVLHSFLPSRSSLMD